MNGMPSLDRHLIKSCVGLAVTLLGSPTATRPERLLRIRTRLAGWRCRLLQSRRTMSNKIVIRKKTKSSGVTIPSILASGRCDSTAAMAGRFVEPPVFAADGALAAPSLSATTESAPTALLLPVRTDRSPASIPLRT